MELPTVRWDFNAYTITSIVVATAMNYAVMSYRVDAIEKQGSSLELRIDKSETLGAQLSLNDANYSIRLNSTIEGLQEVRRVAGEQALIQAKTNGEVLAQLSAIRETLAWFRATLESNGAPRQPQQRAP